MPEIVRRINYDVEISGAEESAEKVKNIEENVTSLKDQLEALKEEPLQLAPEGELPKPPEGEQKKKPLLPRKKLEP